MSENVSYSRSPIWTKSGSSCTVSYTHLIEALPTVEDLAGADEQRVFKLWEGLGYYRRAAHLKEAASVIVNEYHGRFPETYEELLKLKGVGMYTASAIASIAFGIPKGVVDGNTLRIIARLFNREDNIALQRTKNAFGAVSYTHLDVYKRQVLASSLQFYICSW